jgi:hypothetical protein
LQAALRGLGFIVSGDDKQRTTNNEQRTTNNGSNGYDDNDNQC